MIHLISRFPPAILPDGIVLSDTAKCLEYCSSRVALSVDSETAGLDWVTKGIVMLQIGDSTEQFLIDARDTKLDFLKPVLESKKVLKLFHNVKFDYHFLRVAGIMLWNVYDTFLAEMVLYNGYPGKGYSLEALVNRYFHQPMDKEERNKFIGIGSKPFTERQIQYGARDIIFLQDIMVLQNTKAIEDELTNVINLENKAVLALADIEHNGMYLNKEKWLKVATDASKQVEEYRGRLDNIILSDDRFKQFRPKYIQSDMFTPQEDLRKLNINWDSPSQVLKIIKTILPGIPDTNAATLEKHESIKLVNELLRYREFEKQVTTYGPSFVENIHPKTERIHTEFRQLLVTGRVSTSPNMQNIPANNKFRNCFETGYENWVYVSGDYSGQEITIIAVKSKDRVWMKAIQKGEDLHSICAELIYGFQWQEAAEEECMYYKVRQKCKCKEHKILRNYVKTLNFGLAYGMTEKKLAQRLHISEREALKLMQKYFSTFPDIAGFLNTLAAYGIQNGVIKTFMPYKRRRYFPSWRKDMDWTFDKKVIGEIERESKNSPIQGSGADMVKNALNMVLPFIYNNNSPVKLVMQVHDSIDSICPREFAPQWAKDLKRLMEEAALEIIPEGLLKADIGISDVWTKD